MKIVLSLYICKKKGGKYMHKFVNLYKKNKKIYIYIYTFTFYTKDKKRWDEKWIWIKKRSKKKKKKIYNLYKKHEKKWWFNIMNS
jgi:hypothetical protein